MRKAQKGIACVFPELVRQSAQAAALHDLIQGCSDFAVVAGVDSGFP